MSRNRIRSITCHYERASNLTIPETDLGSDYNLDNNRPKVECEGEAVVILSLNSLWPGQTTRLRDPDNTELFQAQAGGEFAVFNIIDDNVDSWRCTLCVLSITHIHAPKPGSKRLTHEHTPFSERHQMHIHTGTCTQHNKVKETGVPR